MDGWVGKDKQQIENIHSSAIDVPSLKRKNYAGVRYVGDKLSWHWGFGW